MAVVEMGRQWQTVVGVLVLGALVLVLLQRQQHNKAVIKALKDRLELQQVQKQTNKNSQHVEVKRSVPDGFIPLSIDACEKGLDAIVTLCYIDYTEYHAAPHKYPMQRMLVEKYCTRKNSIQLKVSDIIADDQFFLDPAGLVFHESRVGSTLTANLLAVDEQNLVHSEASMPASIAMHCSLPRSEKVGLLRQMMRAMSNSQAHSRMFFKLQSVNALYIDLYTEAFPNTPWIYLFRNPVEVMMSHLSRGKSMSAPCLRRMQSKKYSNFLREYGLSTFTMKPEMQCASYISSLSKAALDEINKEGSNGVAVNYQVLVRSLRGRIFPNHFGYSPSPDVVFQQEEEQKEYAKSKGHDRVFVADGKKKRSAASKEVLSASKSLADDIFNKLVKVAMDFISEPPKKGPKLPTRRAVASPVKHTSAERSRRNIANLIDLKRSKGSGKEHHPWDDPWYFDPNGKEPYYKPEESLEGNYLPYPPLRPLKEILDEWSPDDMNTPDDPLMLNGSLEVLDFQDEKQRLRAKELRLNEVPFKLLNVPFIDDTVNKWKDDSFLQKHYGDTPLRVTHASTNHFKYFHKIKAQHLPYYSPPTKTVHMTFDEFMSTAHAAEHASLQSDHWYLQLRTKGTSEWIYEDLKEWRPQFNFWFGDPTANQGIDCRFGARGISASNHYDGGRNFIAMLRGKKRYIIAPPTECPNMHLFPQSHPEARHSMGDWANLDYKQYPNYLKVKAINVVLSAGEVLYLPSYWFHHIISTTLSIQCNCRSGMALRGRKLTNKCDSL
eukprot:m.225597 g.225597  ORF g.225597 m.225597 type:complete len:775 (+) comp13860_c0_seq31:68-2392(+)